MDFKLPWSIKFDMHGGYDCMTSAYFIRDKNEKIITEIDTGIVGQCGENNESVIEAKEIAKFIVNSVNGVGCDANIKHDLSNVKGESQ